MTGLVDAIADLLAAEQAIASADTDSAAGRAVDPEELSLFRFLSADAEARMAAAMDANLKGGRNG